MITITNLHKSFGKLAVLKGINLAFENQGKVIAILGPNGSGKTTLIKSILGMVIPDQGTIHIEDKDISGQCSYRNKIDYLPQIAKFPEHLTVRELITLIRDIRKGKTCEAELIETFGLQPYLDKYLNNLSGGTKQKVNLTLAFMYDSPIVILDEPTNGLDPVAMIHFRALINEKRQQGKIILITTHIMSLVESIADEVIFLLEGHIFFRGSLDLLKAENQENSVEAAIAKILNRHHTC